jgi:hypothetical protein
MVCLHFTWKLGEGVHTCVFEMRVPHALPSLLLEAEWGIAQKIDCRGVDHSIPHALLLRSKHFVISTNSLEGNFDGETATSGILIHI